MKGVGRKENVQKGENKKLEKWIRKNYEYEKRSIDLEQQHKYLTRENEELRKKIEAFKSIQVRIEGL